MIIVTSIFYLLYAIVIVDRRMRMGGKKNELRLQQTVAYDLAIFQLSRRRQLQQIIRFIFAPLGPDFRSGCNRGFRVAAKPFRSHLI